MFKCNRYVKCQTTSVVSCLSNLAYFLSCMREESVHQLGWSLLKKLYPEAVDIAKTVTGLENETEAVKSFRQFIHSPSMYFNEEPFPKNESDERAHRKCNSERGKTYASTPALNTEQRMASLRQKLEKLCLFSFFH